MWTWIGLLCISYGLAQLLALLLSRKVIAEPLKISINSIDASKLPPLSIVIAARNEEKTIQPALKKLLELEYPNLEIILINDRSTDQTPAIAHELANLDSHLKVLNIQELPSGWLGKNHALHRGQELAQSDWILFTDADVHFEKHSLMKIMSLAAQSGADHFPGFARIYSRNAFLHGFMNFFAMQFFFFVRPWQIKKNNRKGGFGVGAFNLLRKDALRAVGGFERISLRPDDDVQLGLLLRKEGFHLLPLRIDSEVTVEWYATIGECLGGLEKNFFAGLDYSIGAAAGTVIFFVGHSVLSFAGLFTSAWPIFLIAILFHFFNYAACCSLTHSPRKNALLYFVYQLFFAFITIRTTFLNLYNGGLSWRDHFYDLETLKSQKSLK